MSSPSPDPAKYPLCAYFLSGYFKKNPNDAENFPPDQFPDGFFRYEALLHDALFHLKMTREDLRARQEFNFDSGDTNNLESAIGVLRAAIHLGQAKFSDITLIKSKQKWSEADLTAQKNDRKVCFEVKTITKRSKGKKDHFFADQLYEKIRESIAKARKQLTASAAKLNCNFTVYTCVVNWFSQTIYLNQDDYQSVVNRLEEHGEEKSLEGVDGVWFILKNGNVHGFLIERAKVLDT
jgi:Holliday junction resolvase-like predicted endonuclease